MAGGIYTWDLTRPSLGEAPASDAGPANLFIIDKTTLAAILSTLTPFGTALTGWKQVQINDDTWLVQNATWTGTQWNYNNNTLAAMACTQEISGPYFRWLFAAAGANPITWTELSRMTSTGLWQPGVDATYDLGTDALRYRNLKLSGGINPTGNLSFTLGQSAPAVGAAAGFPYFPSMAGAASGVPTAITGFAPVAWDDTNKIFQIYSPGSAAWQRAIPVPLVTVITTTGTYNVPAWARALWVRIVAGGGGGANGSNSGAGGGGGGAGAYSEGLYTSLLASYAVTIGLGGAVATDGGDSAFGALITAVKGGKGTAAQAGAAGGAAGAGGAMNRSGAGGGPGSPFAGGDGWQGGNGGATPFGGSGSGGAGSGTPGTAAGANTGSGGGGGGCGNGVHSNGAAGADGQCVIVAF